MKPLNQWTEEDVENFREKVDRVLFHIVRFTVIACFIMLAVSIIYQHVK